jgi:hypothetical protein
MLESDEDQEPDLFELRHSGEDLPDEVLAGIEIGAIRFDQLSPTDFEEFCFDLLQEVGFQNVDWRKGTPLAASPADRGRDIVAEQARTDFDGHQFVERWFVDCKHYERGVPPDALHTAMAWAAAERPATLLFIASGYFTNAAKDWIEDYGRENRPPFRIRVWEAPQLRQLLSGHLDVAFRHDVSTSTLRRVSEILRIESELTDKLWYGRKPNADEPLPDSMKNVPAELIEGMRAAQKRMEDQYGRDELLSHVESQFAWGMLSGKVSAIRWVLGEEWDMLDS